MSRFRQNLQRGTLTARQWEEEMRAGDDRHMYFVDQHFKESVCIAALRLVHGYAASALPLVSFGHSRNNCLKGMAQFLIGIDDAGQALRSAKHGVAVHD